MNLQVILGLLLTILPIFELRGGLPVIIEYAERNSLNIWPFFVIVLFLNILVIFFVFVFLDFLHGILMKVGSYNRFMTKYLENIRKKSLKVQKKTSILSYFALFLLVAIPFPGTGAWTGTLVAWFLKMKRVESIIAIALGVIVAGFIVLALSLSLFNGIY